MPLCPYTLPPCDYVLATTLKIVSLSTDGKDKLSYSVEEKTGSKLVNDYGPITRPRKRFALPCFRNDCYALWIEKLADTLRGIKSL